MRTRRYRNRRIGDFLKELHLVEGRNTGIPTAIREIKKNGSPLPIFLTDEDRTFFSVTIPIHEAFINDDYLNSKLENIKKKRRSKDENKELILETLDKESYSANELYRSLGYSGNASKTFREIIEELIDENIIYNSSTCVIDSNNVLKMYDDGLKNMRKNKMY